MPTPEINVDLRRMGTERGQRGIQLADSGLYCTVSMAFSVLGSLDTVFKNKSLILLGHVRTDGLDNHLPLRDAGTCCGRPQAISVVWSVN